MKEWIDQPLHMLMIAGLFLGAHFQWSILSSCLFAMFWMVLRELEQHRWVWREVGRTDLKFCLLACILCSLASLYFSPH